MVDSAAEKDGATPSAPAPSSEAGSAEPSSGAQDSVSKESGEAGGKPSSGAEGSASGRSGPSGDGPSGDGPSGDGTSGDETSGDGTSGDGTSGDGTSGDGTSGDGTGEDTTTSDETSARDPDTGEPDTLADGKADTAPDDELDTLAGKAKTDSGSADESGARAATPRSSPSVSTPRPRGPIPSDTSTAPQMPAAGSAASKADPPGELAPAESDVPPPPQPTSHRRPPAKTVSLDTPGDALASEAATEKRHAARRADGGNDIDASWGSKPALPPRPRTPRPRPTSSTEASSSPASLGLGARPLSKRPLTGTIEQAAVDDEPETAEASRPAALASHNPASLRQDGQPLDGPDADATAALPPHASAPPHASNSAAPPAPAAPVGPTAAELHREDEDDPTIVNYPQGAADDERTAVHPSRGPFIAPIPGRQDDASLEPKKTAEFPPGFNPAAFASREAAVEAALAAATGKQDDEAKPLREQQIVVAIATLLGVGMVLGALGAYLTARAVAAGDADAGASLAGANVVCCISLFAAGFASLQPKQQARIGLCVASGAMLLIGFIWILGASMG